MGRIPDYSFNGDENQQSFSDAVRRIINFGKTATPLITSLPSWAAEPGERVLFRPTSGGTTEYVYFDSAWVSTWSITV